MDDSQLLFNGLPGDLQQFGCLRFDNRTDTRFSASLHRLSMLGPLEFATRSIIVLPVL